MDRRSFIKKSFGLAVALAVPIELIPESVKGNQWMRPEEVAEEALGHLHDAMRYITVNGTTGEFYVGDTIKFSDGSTDESLTIKNVFTKNKEITFEVEKI